MLKVVLGGGLGSRPDERSPRTAMPFTPRLLSIQALPLVLRLKADCPNARFVYASQSSCATAHRQYKADQLPQVLIFKDGAMVTQVAPSGGAMRRAHCPMTLAPPRTPPRTRTRTDRLRDEERMLA